MLSGGGGTALVWYVEWWWRASPSQLHGSLQHLTQPTAWQMSKQWVKKQDKCSSLVVSITEFLCTYLSVHKQIGGDGTALVWYFEWWWRASPSLLATCYMHQPLLGSVFLSNPQNP
ncbi:hypothetical protein EMCRGX_G008124, partial [Ephydatia muelleri]